LIQHVNSASEVIEPNSYSFLHERKDTFHAHVPFSFLYTLFPTAWFDYIVIQDRKSRILKDVKVKLDSGIIKILSYVLLRFSGSSSVDEIGKYIVNKNNAVIDKTRFNTKGTLNYYTEKVPLSLFTKNKDDAYLVVVGKLNILYQIKHKKILKKNILPNLICNLEVYMKIICFH